MKRQLKRRVLSATRLRDWRACVRLDWLKNELGFRPVDKAHPLRFGDLVDGGLRAWWGSYIIQPDGLPGQMPLSAAGGAPLAAALEAIDEAAGGAGDGRFGLDGYDVARAKAMLTAYHERWSGEPYRVLAVQQRFDVPLPTPNGRSTTWRFRGAMDAVLLLAPVSIATDSSVVIVECKSSGEDISPGSPYFRALRLDAQVSSYYEAAERLGHRVAGVLYDVLGKPEQKPLKATAPESRKYRKDGALYANQRDTDETPAQYQERVLAELRGNLDRYYRREVVVRLERERAEFVAELHATARAMTAAYRDVDQEALRVPPRNPEACGRFGRPCAYLPVCEGTASITDPTLYTIRRSDEEPKEKAA